MLPDMFGTSFSLIMVEVIVDSRDFSVGLNESYKICDMDFLSPVLEIQTKINNLSLLFAKLIKGKQETRSKFINDSLLELKKVLNLSISIVFL
jgi:hypothetical protein